MNDDYEEVIFTIKEYKVEHVSEHTKNMCDECSKEVGKKKLIRAPFLYMDFNDKDHRDLGRGYRQYWLCKSCYELNLR